MGIVTEWELGAEAPEDAFNNARERVYAQMERLSEETGYLAYILIEN